MTVKDLQKTEEELVAISDKIGLKKANISGVISHIQWTDSMSHYDDRDESMDEIKKFEEDIEELKVEYFEKLDELKIKVNEL